MFSEDVESAICLGRLAAGDKFSVVATYVGTSSDAEFVYELYGTLAESEAVDLPIAVILPMTTGLNILPNTSAQLTGRCEIGPRRGFVAERIVVDGAADWVFNDIKIGRASQFAESGDIPGLAFSPRTLGGQVSFDVARSRINFAITTTYIGPRENGNSFVCGILGSIVDLTEVSPTLRHGRILSVRDLRGATGREFNARRL